MDQEPRRMRPAASRAMIQGQMPPMPDSPTPPLIRPATPADVPALGQLGALLVQEHYEFDQRRFIAARPDTSEHYGAFLGSQISEPDAVLLVAEQDGEVIGYVYAVIEGYDYMALRGPAAVLHDLIAAPGHRGRGVGRAMLTAMIAALTARRAPRLVLSTAERNESAQRFFDRAGFRRTMIEMTRELE
jgi:ribosomal protein S18 acetylase RimI-like enzyme